MSKDFNLPPKLNADFDDEVASIEEHTSFEDSQSQYLERDLPFSEPSVTKTEPITASPQKLVTNGLLMWSVIGFMWGVFAAISFLLPFLFSISAKIHTYVSSFLFSAFGFSTFCMAIVSFIISIITLCYYIKFSKIKRTTEIIMSFIGLSSSSLVLLIILLGYF